MFSVRVRINARSCLVAARNCKSSCKFLRLTQLKLEWKKKVVCLAYLIKLNFEYVWSFAICFKTIWLSFSLFMTQMTYLSNEYRGIPQVVMESES